MALWMAPILFVLLLAVARWAKIRGEPEEPARINEVKLAAARQNPHHRELADAVRRYWTRVRESGFGR